MKLLATFVALALSLPALGDLTTGIPDAAPAGFEEWESPIVQPAKNVTGDGDWASAVARAKAFVSKLTLEEKINVTTGIDVEGRCVGNTGTIPRFGWNGLCLEDSPLGVRLADLVSAFPAGINVAMTWDKNLMYARGKAMGQEHRGKGVNVALGPMTNLGRVAAGGRNWEGFGADPYLAGVASAQTTKGYQDVGVIACVKHYIGNEQEHFRGGSEAPQVYSSNVGDKTLHELYLWPFAEAVNAGVGSVMCSYNKINQTQSCQNSKLINGVLKEELDFQGFVLSDWAALINGVQPALAGTDMNMPGFTAYGQGPQDEENPDNTTNSWWGSALIESVKNGSVPEWRVDDMVVRTFAAYYKMGQDRNYPPVSFSQLTEQTYLNGVKVNEHVNVQGDHYKVIREIGGASTVLLKNKGALPLSLNKIKRIGIFGSDAGPNPDGPNGCSDRGCDQGTLAMGWGSGTANFPYLIDPSAAINAYVNANKPTIPVEAVLNDFNYAQVADVAAVADTCLVFTNAMSGEGYITVDTNAGDRNNLTLWHAGDALINATASQCSNTIVIMHAVGPVLVEAWIDHPNVTAVLYAGLPGQETGNAIVDVLFGTVNPSGRLPHTIAKSRSDYPADVLYTSSMETPQITYEEGVNIDYRHFDAAGITPRFEFGFGLSYTTFAYSGLRISGSVHKRGVRSAVSSAASSVSASASLSTVASSSLASATSSLFSSASTLSASSAPLSSSAASSAASATITASASSNASVSISASGSFSLNATSSASLNATSSISSNATATGSAPPAISSPAQTHPGGPANLFDTLYTISYTVSNTGGVDGNEVSQLYLSFPASANEPPRVLRGFDRSFIRRGGAAHISLPLRRKDISIWDVVSQKWVIPSGTFKVSVGSSSRQIHLTGTFNV
ncbi:beta-glucosidase [Punctularia strigosozonata HHB-11173 SS5]|uniref:beta-glucosidase n=1 Tax=Punctularia strigosozonata (strain HHB-11173) TaxID=741275 RepID=UPI0004416D74|nr:beta-glucosidase [Punctularia strigosozonata HHB-11173 SS5]EIN06360.1 beta-glucosidase [Punctularia strigosozonata HHB-11173 SS5]